MKCECGMEYKTEYNDTCPRCGAAPASQSELIKALGVPAGNTTVEWSAEDEEQARIDNMDIQRMTECGHTLHCAQRLIWGDGQCECGLESW